MHQIDFRWVSKGLQTQCNKMFVDGGHLRGSATVCHVGVHICVHSRHLYMSVVKSLYVRTFKTWYVLA